LAALRADATTNGDIMDARRLGLGVLRGLLASALLLGALTLSHAADSSVLSIPVVTPLSGPTSVIGQDVVKSLDIAVRHIAEDGGVLGRKLELKIVDTQGKPDVMRRELERLARLENAPLVLGCEVSAATAAAAQFAEQFKVPYLNSAAVATDILERGYGWYFSDQITGDDEARAVTSFVEHLVTQRRGAPAKFAFLFEDSPRGAGTIDATNRICGGRAFERLAVGVVVGDELIDALHELLDAGERSVPDGLVGDECEETLDLVQPGCHGPRLAAMSDQLQLFSSMQIPARPYTWPSVQLSAGCTCACGTPRSALRCTTSADARV
jgi:hypothetical protein